LIHNNTYNETTKPIRDFSRDYDRNQAAIGSVLRSGGIWKSRTQKTRPSTEKPEPGRGCRNRRRSEFVQREFDDRGLADSTIDLPTDPRPANWVRLIRNKTASDF